MRPSVSQVQRHYLGEVPVEKVYITLPQTYLGHSMRNLCFQNRSNFSRICAEKRFSGLWLAIHTHPTNLHKWNWFHWKANGKWYNMLRLERPRKADYDHY